jgi:hypothetical protein
MLNKALQLPFGGGGEVFALASLRRHCSVIIAAVVVAAFLVVLAPGAQAEQQVLRHAFPLKIGAFETSLPVEAQVDMAAFGTPMPFVLRADLGPLIEQREALISSAGLNDPHDRHVSYRGTLIEVKGDDLWLKYHVEVTKGFLSSGGSVEAWFKPIVTENSLNLALDEEKGEKNSGLETRISNDIVRAIADGLDVDDRLRSELSDKVSAFLASDEATLGVPEELRAANVQFASARFAVVDGKPVLEATGSLTMGVEAWTALIKAMLS